MYLQAPGKVRLTLPYLTLRHQPGVATRSWLLAFSISTSELFLRNLLSVSCAPDHVGLLDGVLGGRPGALGGWWVPVCTAAHEHGRRADAHATHRKLGLGRLGMLPGWHDMGQPELGSRRRDSDELCLRQRGQLYRHGGGLPRPDAPGDAGRHGRRHRQVAEEHAAAERLTGPLDEGLRIQ